VGRHKRHAVPELKPTAVLPPLRRDNDLTFRPREAGEGDHWSTRSERTVMEGAPDSELRYRRGKFSPQEEARENVRTLPKRL
jgi:hypothetical protein